MGLLNAAFLLPLIKLIIMTTKYNFKLSIVVEQYVSIHKTSTDENKPIKSRIIKSLDGKNEKPFSYQISHRCSYVKNVSYSTIEECIIGLKNHLTYYTGNEKIVLNDDY